MTQPRDKASELFMGLVASLQISALQSLGKLLNPLTGKVESDLPGAAASIDMLDMLAEKTRGNLKEEESRLLTETISLLKLNYVEEVNRPAPTPPAPPASAPENPPEGNPTTLNK
jgi:hypothetical protein